MTKGTEKAGIVVKNGTHTGGILHKQISKSTKQIKKNEQVMNAAFKEAERKINEALHSVGVDMNNMGLREVRKVVSPVVKKDFIRIIHDILRRLHSEGRPYGKYGRYYTPPIRNLKKKMDPDQPIVYMEALNLLMKDIVEETRKATAHVHMEAVSTYLEKVKKEAMEAREGKWHDGISLALQDVKLQ